MPKTAINRRRSLSFVLLLGGAIFGCGGDGPSDIQEPEPVASVTLTAPSTSLGVGETVQLTATARDANGAVVEGRTFEWSSADVAIASVSPGGLVTGHAEGQAEISATADGVPGTLAITVTAAPPITPPTLGLQEIASGLDFPTYLTSPPGDERLFILEKDGAIRILKGGTLLPTPFLDLRGQVSTGAEQGLLGLAFYPDYATTGRFIVHYTDLSGASRISLFMVSADPDRADPAESVVLEVSRPGHAHNGGQVLFGPDGMLYIGLGDGADQDGGRGQSLRDLLASILRIDVSAGAGYTIPSDNPFVTTADARPEIWSYGLRNPWRFSFDRATGDLYIGEVGESRYEEVNYSSAAEGAGRGLNYGWSRMEGLHCVGNNCDQTGLTLPVIEYSHSDGCSVTGGYVYRGSAIPGLQGTYFYSDFCRGWVRSLRMAGSVVTEETDWPSLRPEGFVTSFGEDATGELYLMIEEGGVFKIVGR